MDNKAIVMVGYQLHTNEASQIQQSKKKHYYYLSLCRWFKNNFLSLGLLMMMDAMLCSSKRHVYIYIYISLNK